MSWLDSIFARADSPRAPNIAPVVQSFDERILPALNSLAEASRRSGAAVSPQVFSMLRSLDDVLRPLLAHVALHPVVVEREVAIESMITDYVPTSLRLYLELPESDRVDGGKADRLLQEQYTALEKSARQLSANIYDDSLAALETQSIFIQTKFNR